MAVNFYTILKELFPQELDKNLMYVIGLVQETTYLDNDDLKLQIMADMLNPGSDDWEPPLNPQPSTSGTEQTNNTLQNSNFENLLTVFPDANPSYLWQFCSNQGDAFDLDETIEKFSQDGYEKIEMDPLTIWEQLKNALPDADPLYLREEATKLAKSSQQDMDDFLQNAIDNGGFPTMQDYLKQRKQQEELALYKNQFNVHKFLEIIPNPEAYFSNPERTLALDDNSNETDIKYALTFLYNKYSFTRKKYIDLLFNGFHKNLIIICERLDKMNKSMRRPRFFEYAEDTNNVALLQEVTYLSYRKQIMRELKFKEDYYRLAKEEAKEYNLLEECKTCYDKELIPEECYFCPKGCVFCKDCLKTGAETIIGKGDFRFPCFYGCDSEFSLPTLKMVLPENTFERLVGKIAIEEIQKLNMEGLETCPFCPFMMILPSNEKIFKCRNPECYVESCRECKQKSHVPLRCSQIEYDEDVKRRTYIENKMTEALIRTCPSCKRVFTKSSGCNKMTCLCGAKMCYLCKSNIRDYSHFGAGRCPLFTDDAKVNLERVVASAQNAKRDLGNVEIKFDPSDNIEAFFQ